MQTRARADGEDQGSRLDEVVRLLVLALRRDMGSQAELIAELHRSGFSERRIAELVSTTPGTVHVTVQRARKSRQLHSRTGNVRRGAVMASLDEPVEKASI